jgi:hypothetical protein
MYCSVGIKIIKTGINIHIIELNETYLVMITTQTKVPKAIKPNQGEIANNMPPVVDTPFPPDLVFAF